MFAEKRGGAWMDEVVGQTRLLAPPGQDMRLPVAHMVSGFPKASPHLPTKVLGHACSCNPWCTSSLSQDRVACVAAAGVQPDAADRGQALAHDFPGTRLALHPHTPLPFLIQGWILPYAALALFLTAARPHEGCCTRFTWRISFFSIHGYLLL